MPILFLKKIILPIIACIAFPFIAISQTSVNIDTLAKSTLDFVTIENIYITGNKRTKNEVILRELDFSKGDTIPLALLAQRLESNQLDIMNTGLFTDATIFFKEWEGTTNRIGLQITVKESWYVYPFPIIELADRNFNVWWETYNHSLSRLDLGVRFYHTNFTGRRDELKLVGQVGFTKKYELVYTLPYFNRSRTLGLNVNFLNTRDRRIGYNTLDNKLLFNPDNDNILLRRLRIGAGLRYRRRLDIYHDLDFTYQKNTIHENVLQKLNPDFFLTGLKQQYFVVAYQFAWDKRDIRPYPMKGHLVSAAISKTGFSIFDDINSLDATADMRQFFSFQKKWSIAIEAKGKLGLIRKKQPYYQSRALGYKPDFVRGYEFYVIDGLDFMWQKTALRYMLLNKEFNWGKYSLMKSYTLMPVKLYLVFHNEFGYANNPFYEQDNPLSNNILWGTSLGLDLVLYYDKVINFEVSRNRLGEYGFYLHWGFNF